MGGGASELNLSGVREFHAAISTIFGYVVFFVQKMGLPWKIHIFDGWVRWNVDKSSKSKQAHGPIHSFTFTVSHLPSDSGGLPNRLHLALHRPCMELCSLGHGRSAAVVFWRSASVRDGYWMTLTTWEMMGKFGRWKVATWHDTWPLINEWYALFCINHGPATVSPYFCWFMFTHLKLKSQCPTSQPIALNQLMKLS